MDILPKCDVVIDLESGAICTEPCDEYGNKCKNCEKMKIEKWKMLYVVRP